MKVLKRILYVISGIFALFCVFVLLCALNPEISDKIAGMLYGREEQGNQNRPEASLPEIPESSVQESGGTGEEYGDGGASSGMEEDIVPPFEAQEQYIPPGETQLDIPKKVTGKNGYIPLEEDRQQVEDYQSSAGTGQTGENLTFDTEIYPYYGMLSDTLKQVYKQVYANAEALNGSFTPVEAVSASQVKLVMEAVYNDHPELFWLDSSFSCKCLADGTCLEIGLVFNRTAENLETSRSAFTRKANEILSGALRYTNDYEKERYVHDALLGRVTYNLSAALNQSAYSALVNGETVCAGYARAFQYLLQQLGIPCYYCTGYAGENHAWNIVKLDGEFYNVDTTWDDTGSGTYDYFNKNDRDFTDTHIRRDLSIYLPACSGEKYRNLKWEAPKEEEEPEEEKKEESSSGGAVISGPNANYSGAVLKSLTEYYDNCYVQMLKGGKGTVRFKNIITPAVLEALYTAYSKEEYTKGYMDKLLKELEADDYTINIEINPASDGNYLLDHTITLK